MSAEWMAISNELAQAAEQAGVHTVAVHSEARGSSSGVMWRPGVLVTAEHALRRDEEIQVTLPGGRVASAKLAGRDRSSDLAVLKKHISFLEWEAAKLGYRSEASDADEVLAQFE